MSEDQTMIERVARACWQTQTIRAWEDAHETEREEMIGYARAAIEAMRSPAEAMALAGATAHNVWGFGHTDAAIVFDAMIDAALNAP